MSQRPQSYLRGVRLRDAGGIRQHALRQRRTPHARAGDVRIDGLPGARRAVQFQCIGPREIVVVASDGNVASSRTLTLELQECAGQDLALSPRARRLLARQYGLLEQPPLSTARSAELESVRRGRSLQVIKIARWLRP